MVNVDVLSFLLLFDCARQEEQENEESQVDVDCYCSLRLVRRSHWMWWVPFWDQTLFCFVLGVCLCLLKGVELFAVSHLPISIDFDKVVGVQNLLVALSSPSLLVRW